MEGMIYFWELDVSYKVSNEIVMRLMNFPWDQQRSPFSNTRINTLKRGTAVDILPSGDHPQASF